MTIATLPATARIEAIRTLLRHAAINPKGKQAIIDHLRAIEAELRGEG